MFLLFLPGTTHFVFLKYSLSPQPLMSIPLQIAIIGTGLIGPRHAQSVLSNPNTELVAIVDPAEHAHTLATSMNISYYPSISALLSSSHQIEAAVICTPNSTHVPLALELIAAGIDVLVEKPISTSIDSGKQLVEAAKERNVKILVGHHRRFNPYLVAAKIVVDDGELGRTIAVQGCWCTLKPASYFVSPTEWRQSGKEGGVILINLIHEIDLLQYLFGPIVLVHALEAPKTRGFEAEEGAAIVLRFESGTVGTFVLSDVVASPWNFEAGTGENPMIPKVPAEQEAGGFYRIMGTEGSLSVSDLTKWSYKENGKGWTEILEKSKVEVDMSQVPFDLQMQHFVDVVRNGATPSCSGEEGLRAIVVCEAVKTSMKRGLPVAIHGFEMVG